MGKYKLTVGADPEFLVMEVDKSTKKQAIVPACRRFGGEKRAPIFISPDGGYLEDGVTVEFNVTPSASLATTRKKLFNLQLVFANKHDSYKIANCSSATFKQEDLDKFPEACSIGCSPDLSAYGLRLAPDIKKFGTRRFAGGHIHIGISPWPEGLEKSMFIKFMDLAWLAPLSGYIDQSRWEFYGHPGLYRETEYGVEYRSPDNGWCNSAYVAALDSETRTWLADRVDTMDLTLRCLIEILDKDGHGARVNDEIEGIVYGSGINDVMSMLSFTDGPHRIRAYRVYGTEMYNFLQRWLHNRDRKIDPRLAEALKKAS